MKVLIVAHPDDEVLWFNPEEFDRIVIVFVGRDDVVGQTEGRRRALAEHPLASKITVVGLTESGALRDKSPETGKRHVANYLSLCNFLRGLEADEVVTHNAMGEYQHPDHTLVHNACMSIFRCPVNGKNPEMYRRIREVYERNGCWTWH